MYADDTLFYYADHLTYVVSTVLQQDLLKIADWLDANKLSLHIGKTTSMPICSNQTRMTLNPKLDLSLNGQAFSVSQTEECKYLGVTFDHELTFDGQVDDTVIH